MGDIFSIKAASENHSPSYPSLLRKQKKRGTREKRSEEDGEEAKAVLRGKKRNSEEAKAHLIFTQDPSILGRIR